MRKTLAAYLSVTICSTNSAAVALTIALSPVGNSGNPADSTTGYGSVGYDYRIGTYEVTNSQYAEFLTAKVPDSDPLGLYVSLMGYDLSGGISRSGLPGNFTYTARENMGDKPVTFVSWYDAIRFANWLHNGQGSGDTESGAYTLLGGTPTPTNGDSITRNPGATWFLPSEDEWYKAAYYQPEGQGGDSDNYWAYPTRSNSVPSIATANSSGDIDNPGTNVANYNRGADWRGDGNVTTVGSAGPSSASFYGTSDQAGNVFEWNEGLNGGFFRGLRGGGWELNSNYLPASSRTYDNPSGELPGRGFRVASAVPEPSGFALAVFALLGLFALMRRR